MQRKNAHVKTEEETGVLSPRNADSQQPPQARRSKERILPSVAHVSVDILIRL